MSSNSQPKYDPLRHDRQSIRLRGHDYSEPGKYFVTICTKDRECLFGEIVEGEMWLNETGLVVQQCWREIPNHFPYVALDEFIVMPNHVHGIIVICKSAEVNNGLVVVNVGAKDISPLRQNDESLFHSPSKTIGSIVRGFKTGVTKWFRNKTVVPYVWQRNYHDRIIRDETELRRICQYIRDNPLHWDQDEENPKRQAKT